MSDHPADHKPFTDDGVTYCGWRGDATVINGCGELWPCSTIRATTGPSTEAVGEVRRRVEQVLGDLDVDAIEEKWLQECGQCDYGVGYPCTHPADDYRPTMLRLVGEVRRLRMLVGSVTLHGMGYRWRRTDGEVLILHPAEVDVFLAADQVTELEKLRTELEASALAAERLFEQRDTAIRERDEARAEAESLRARLQAATEDWAEARDDLAAFSQEVARLYEVEREAERMRKVVEAAKAWANAQLGAFATDDDLALLAAVDAYTTKEAAP